MDRPLIGITTFRKQEEDLQAAFGRVGCSYVQAVYEAGALPLPIPIIDSNYEEVKNYVKLIDGLVLSGGQDISPEFYKENVDSAKNCDKRRDKWEVRLFLKAYRLNLPILGICRGLQLMNVACGGSLYQDLEKQFAEVASQHLDKHKNDYSHHKIEVIPNSQLSDILCSVNSIEVNSRHHQAAKEIADNFKISAKSDRGIVEAIEDPDKNFVVGVQWHPEDLINDNPCFNQLFSALVEEAIKIKYNHLVTTSRNYKM